MVPLINTDVVVVFMRLDQMLDHVGQHLPHVAVGDAVEDLLAPPTRLQQTSGGQVWWTPAPG